VTDIFDINDFTESKAEEKKTKKPPKKGGLV